MIFERRFTIAVGTRLTGILALAGAVGLAAHVLDSFVATVCVLVGLASLLFFDVLRIVRQANDDLASLMDALRNRDLARHFTPRFSDQGFEELARDMQALIDQLQRDMRVRASEASYRADLLAQVPIPILLIDDAGRVEHLNSAARRMFACVRGTQAEDYRDYGEPFIAALRGGASDTLVQLTPPGDAPFAARVTQSQFQHQGQPGRMLSLQPIQTELDRAEALLARDIVRVLTHEIMNSLTPVTSLATTAAALASSLPQSPIGNEVRVASETVARRAQGLLDFVAQYRAVTTLPKLQIGRLLLRDQANEWQTLFDAEWKPHEISLQVHLTPADLAIDADAGLLSQVILNLLKNAAQAVCNQTGPRQIELSIDRGERERVRFAIDDSGPGVPAATARDIFLPFYTTKPDGSGVGLSFARQVVLAHGGSIRVERSALGGARFCMVI